MEAVQIIYSDADVVVVNKPAGLLVHPVFHKDKHTGEWVRHTNADGVHEETLTDILVAMYPEMSAVGDSPQTRPGVVHRLDRETSGVMIMARNQKAFLFLKELFQNHDLVKTYRAIARGIFTESTGVIDKPISIINGTVKRTVHAGRMQRAAITNYRVLTQYAEWALVEAQPVTGRTHQIRLHLASVGHPIAGDVLYGSKKQKPEWAARCMLHAYSLAIRLPSGTRSVFEAPVPSDFADALRVLE